MAGDIFQNRQEQGVFNLRKKGKTSVDWAKLPSELLVEIIENYLVSVDDYAAVSGVCRCWRKAVVGCDTEGLKHNWGRQMPWLLLTDGNEEILNMDGPYASVTRKGGGGGRRRSVLNLLRNGKKYNVNFPQGYGRSCWGSSHGWILTHDATRNMYLFNHLTNTRLNLPSETTLPKRRYFDNYFVDRAAIFKDVRCGVDDDNVAASNLLVVLIYGHSCNIAFAKPGDTQWTEVITKKAPVIDVLYRVVDGDARLIFLDHDGDLAHCHLNLVDQQPQPPIRRLTWYDSELELLQQQFWSDYSDLYSYNAYLVNSGEDLLMVLWLLELDQHKYDQDNIIGNYRTVHFRVYKFLFDANRWEELEDLLDVAVFVGNNATMSICATHAGCQPNCIYFTDDNRKYYLGTEDRLGGHDMGVFRIKDKTIKPFHVKINYHTRSSYCCPLWFSPAL